MPLQPTSTHKTNAGFTLIELVLAIGLTCLLGGLGLVVSMDFYRSYSSNLNTNILVSTLERARSRSLDNINEAPHGVHITSGNYILFQGPSYGSDPAYDEPIPVNAGVTTTGLSDIVFDQLTGETSQPGIIVVHNGPKTASISINSDGRIDW